jgi:hypothetical protein
MRRLAVIVSLTLLPAIPVVTVHSQAGSVETPPLQISGIYPHLAVFNDTGSQQDNECGIGAVVAWAGRLWLLTYPPHQRTGSADKLYQIDGSLHMTVRPESVGGTHAGRLIHWESQQLILGPYFIDAEGNVRAIDQKNGFPARITAIARHLTDPANKVYVYDMEGPIWEVNVHTLAAERLFVKPVPGWHGKGAYTSQGRLIVANNGERRTADLDGLTWELPESQWTRGPEDAGVLAEFDGRQWTIVSRRSHTDVTGPGGLLGERGGDAPVWSIGWDKRSVLLDVRADGEWHTYRLPKGSYTYDPTHGWFTEWPRIRSIGEGQMLLNMHGTFFDFPSTFTVGRTAGIRALGTHLHYTTDFTEWNGRVVLAGDDTSIQQNELAAKPQSNLRLVTLAELAHDFGPRSGWGGPWVRDPVKAGQPSAPFLIAGYEQRYLHLAHDSASEVTFSLEIDLRGDGHWQPWKTVRVPRNGYSSLLLPPDAPGEWLRVTADRDCTATAFLHMETPAEASTSASRVFASLMSVDANGRWTGGLLRPAHLSRDLQFLARTVDADGRPGPETYYEVDEGLRFTRVDAPALVTELQRVGQLRNDYTVDAASVLVIDDSGDRWRLPKRMPAVEHTAERGLREVISERYLANFDGTFYEIPRRADSTGPDFRHMKPIASHRAHITDFCTWRGLLVLAGTNLQAPADGHLFRAAASGAGLWFGAIDDLYKLGAPAGEGGPWKDTAVKAGEPSDPYLMTNFGRKTVALSHDSTDPVSFTIQVDFLADGSWNTLEVVEVPPGQTIDYRLPDGFAAHWVRVTTDRDAKATAWFRYEPMTSETAPAR